MLTKDNGPDVGQAPGGDQPHTQTLHHWVYVVGFSVFAGLVALPSLWPINHFLAILLFATAISLVVLNELRARRISWSGAIGAVAFVFVVALVVYIVVGPVPIEETATHGWLVAASDPPAQTACPNLPMGPTAKFESPEKAVTVALGHSGVVIPFLLADEKDGVDLAHSFNTAKRHILRVGQCDAVSITRSDEGILVDADVFNPRGEIVATIAANEFHLVSAQYAYSERPDRSTLILYGKKKEEIFWLKFLNQRSIKIRGYFACEGKAPIQVTDDQILLPRGGHASKLCVESYPNGIGLDMQ